MGKVLKASHDEIYILGNRKFCDCFYIILIFRMPQKTLAMLRGIEPRREDRQSSSLPLTYGAIKKFGGTGENRTHRSLLAKQSRPLGTFGPI